MLLAAFLLAGEHQILPLSLVTRHKLRDKPASYSGISVAMTSGGCCTCSGRPFQSERPYSCNKNTGLNVRSLASAHEAGREHRGDLKETARLMARFEVVE